MNASETPVALLYDDDGYVEMFGRPPQAGGERIGGPIGRQVAGKEFLEAYLRHGVARRIVALVRNQPSLETLTRYVRGHPSQAERPRDLVFVPEPEFLTRFFPDAPAGVLYTPCPPDLRYAWARHAHGPTAFALSGVTHTLCSKRALEWLGELLTAPFEPYDSLICTSKAVLNMVRAVTDEYAEYLRERLGASPRMSLRLEVIPLGVDTEKFHPASLEERAKGRELLGIAPDEIVVLFVGRLLHHTKAHPFPIFRGLSEAVRITGRPVRLLMTGWTTNAAILEAFQEGARKFAGNLHTTFVDGARPELRTAVWHAADIFTSLADNIQETFGLVIVEAMASGLPVVASDWNGYRDLVVDGSTGFLVPTLELAGATADATMRLQMESLDYDHYLAECSQAVAVDCGQAATAFARLLADDSLRRRMGAAGRERAVSRFAWPHVIRAYEALWREQEITRQEHIRLAQAKPSHSGRYPAPETAFAGYPTRWLDEGDRLASTPGALERLELISTTPLTNHVPRTRVTDSVLLRTILTECSNGLSLITVEGLFQRAGIDRKEARATLAWLLKYDLLRATSSQDGGAQP